MMKTKQEMQFIIDRISTTWGIACYVLGEDGNSIVCMSHVEDAQVFGEINLKVRCQEVADMVAGVRNMCTNRVMPVLIQDRKQISYFAFQNEEGMLFFAGPFAFDQISFEDLFQFRKRYKIKNKEYMIPVVELKEILNCMVVSFYLLMGKQITEEEILADSEFDGYVHKEDVLAYEMNRQTEEEARLSYEYERRWLASVESGTVDRNQMLLNEENLQKIKEVGNLADKDGYKQIEYMVISAVTLACRAAIRGGINPYDAYNVADLYFQQVAKCHTIMEMLGIYANTMIDFSERVREANENRLCSDVEKCKDYIARNRTKKFTLSDLSKVVGKNASYLSDKFAKEVGMTIQEYTKRQRLEAAANMLVYSDTGIGDIAEYLHFSSQSYFGVCFKNYYHMTPGKYRERYRVIDFEEK